MSRIPPSVVVGLIFAVIATVVDPITGLFFPLLTILHELGHTATAWLFGYLAIPAFDFQYGGGVTIFVTEQSRIAVAALYGLAAVALWTYRRNRLTSGLILTAIVAHAIVAFSPLHEVLGLYMGHGAELLFAGIFLYRALTGIAMRLPAERPVYAFAGFFILIHDLRLGFGLATNDIQRTLYADAKGGGHWMDFSQLANSYLHLDLATVAWLFLGTCAVPVLVAIGLATNVPEWHGLLARLRRRQPAA